MWSVHNWHRPLQAVCYSYWNSGRLGADGEEVLWLKESIIIRGELGAGEEYIASRTF
jgi:hypothetical protein